MKSVLVLLALIGVTCADYDYDYENCKIEGIPIGDDYYDTEFENEPIFDDHVGPILTIPKGTITEVTADDYDNNIAVSIKGDKIVFELVDSLEDYDYNTRTTDQNTTLDQEILFTCPEGETYVYFYQTIADRNNHVPTFNRKVYTYKFGMDVAAGFDLTDLVDIIVVDIDFTDHKMTFSIEDNEYLEIKELNKYDSMGKTHYARLTTIKDIKGKFDKTFKIFATDIVEPKQTGEAEVRVIIV